MSPQTRTTLAAVVTGLIVNVVLDLAFDMPTPVRWGVTLVVIIVLSIVLTKLRERRARGRHDDYTFS